ncbi:hypothetical protein K474DRAFT_1669082 [Panus rudis PR-1116 ss-1]|nr:hypothetical protein K474DRAFT_1669082 [Panus rudis PR-1116 ss-1]
MIDPETYYTEPLSRSRTPTQTQTQTQTQSYDLLTDLTIPRSSRTRSSHSRTQSYTVTPQSRTGGTQSLDPTQQRTYSQLSQSRTPSQSRTHSDSRSHSRTNSFSYEIIGYPPTRRELYSDRRSSGSTTASYGQVLPSGTGMALTATPPLPSNASQSQSDRHSTQSQSREDLRRQSLSYAEGTYVDRETRASPSRRTRTSSRSRQSEPTRTGELENPWSQSHDSDSSSSHVLSKYRAEFSPSDQDLQSSSYGFIPQKKGPQSTSRGNILQAQPRYHDSSTDVPSRTLDDVRNQVAESIAAKTVLKAEEVDGCKVGVVLTLASTYASRSSSSSSEGQTSILTEAEGSMSFLRLIASKIKSKFILRDQQYIFIIGTSGMSTPGTHSPILIHSSEPEFVHRATILINAKFIGRLTPPPTPTIGPNGTPNPARSATVDPSGKRYFAFIRDLGLTTFDEAALWDVVRKSAQSLINPHVPPSGSLGIRQILTIARSKLQRVSPEDAYKELSESSIATPWPVILVDIRPQQQRAQYGEIPGALLVERNVLEWRFDPRGKVGDGEDGGRLPIADRYDLRIIIFCQEGYTSSLAAASLHDLGLLNATDVVGGFKAWKEAGLPTNEVTG